ncbi:MAG: hypothetical protein GX259_07595 [Bacteroidales bacterium]|nr:hypothetical protein [Bacteroidales bacterium]
MKTLKTFLSIFVLALSFVLVSCNQKQQNNLNETNNVSEIMQVDSLLNNAEKFVGDTIVIDGVCTHICQHGGKKIFLMGSDDTKTIRVEAGGNIGSFNQETVNSIVEVKGILMEQRIDESFLVNWETELASGTAEEHGDEDGGCATEQKAQNEKPANTEQERIDNFRKRIAERNEKEGKNYLSFYFVEAIEYKIK